jgi:hypothetical protein
MMFNRTLLYIALLGCISSRFLAFSATHDCSLTGSLQSDDDNPIKGHILAYHIEVRHGRRMPSLECSADTDARGHFQCVHLESGSYFLIATGLHRVSDDPRSQPTEPRFLPLLAIYPAETGFDTADLVHLGSGETQSLEMPVHSDVGSDLHVNSAAATAKDRSLQVSLLGEDFVASTEFQISPDSRSSGYTLRSLPPGAYQLMESWSESRGTRHGIAFVSAEQLSSGQATMKEMELQSVAGSVHFPGPKITNSVEVDLKPAASWDSRRYATMVHANSTFSITDIPPGRYYVSLAPQSGFYITDVLISERSSGSSVLTLDKEHSNAPLTLAANAASGSMTGTLKMSHGGQQCTTVTVESLASHTSLQVAVGVQGTFRIEKLAPGEYRLYGWVNVRDVPYDDSSFLRRYADRAVQIELEDGTSANGLEVECNSVGP